MNKQRHTNLTFIECRRVADPHHAWIAPLKEAVIRPQGRPVVSHNRHHRMLPQTKFFEQIDRFSKHLVGKARLQEILCFKRIAVSECESLLPIQLVVESG